MTDPLETFFSAWGLSDPVTRREALAAAMSDEFAYEDPKGRITDLEALTDYVGQFASRMPDGHAVVESTERTDGGTRARVGFGRGGEIMMRGTYHARLDAEGRIAELTGQPDAAA